MECLKLVLMLLCQTYAFLPRVDLVPLTPLRRKPEGIMIQKAPTTITSMQLAGSTEPAVDRYVLLPPAGYSVDQSSTDLIMARGPAAITASGPAPEGPDPFQLVQNELSPLSDYVKALLMNENPVLTMAASHFFDKNQGKRFRPTIVALVGRALQPSVEYIGSDKYSKGLQLGQIAEMIHAASLIHDDVLDESETRRGGKAIHELVNSNKVAVLAGDYMLAQASVLLAKLRNFDVVEIMAGSLDSLVQGELMQATKKKSDLTDMEFYLRKSYFKTASLICSSSKSAALLAGYDLEDDLTSAAEEYGYHLGMTYQIVDDILDFTGASATLGKPAQADMQLGLATAPILFAMEEAPELKQLIQRRFSKEGDVQEAISVASKTDCVAKSYQLAEFHADRAAKAVRRFPPTEERKALLKLLYAAVSRKK